MLHNIYKNLKEECKKWKFNILTSTGGRKYRTYISLKRGGYESYTGTSVMYLCGKRRAWATQCPISCEWDCIGSNAMLTPRERFNRCCTRIGWHREWRLQRYIWLRRLGVYGYQYQWNRWDAGILPARGRRLLKGLISTTWLQKKKKNTEPRSITNSLVTSMFI